MLARYVDVVDEHGESHLFGPGDVVPDWAVGRIHNPDVWARSGVRVAPAVANPPIVTTAATASAPSPAAAPDGDSRPKRNATKDVWVGYAEKVGVAVPEGATRDAIIALVNQAETGSDSSEPSDSGDSGDGLEPDDEGDDDAPVSSDGRPDADAPKALWLAYAESVGIRVEGDLSRDEIVALVNELQG